MKSDIHARDIDSLRVAIEAQTYRSATSSYQLGYNAALSWVFGRPELIPRDDALIALCGMTPLDEDQPYESQILPGYIAYACPRCGRGHQAFDSPRLRRMLEWFEGEPIAPKVTT